MRGALIETEARRIKVAAENEIKKETAHNLIKNGKLTMEEIAECSGLKLAEVEKIAEEEKIAALQLV